MCASHCTLHCTSVARMWKCVVQKMHNCYTRAMSLDSKAVRTYFGKLGLSNDIADLYLALQVHGPQTISQLSRNAHVERTRIYRLIDELMGNNLIEVETHHKRGIIKAAPIANLHILISKKEQELKSLQDELELLQQVFARNSLSNPATRVQFYHGPEGIRQMQWNLFRAKKDIKSIMRRPMQNVTGNTFFKRWTERWNAGEWTCQLILDDHFLQESNEWHKENPGYTAKTHYSRRVDPALFRITHAMDIYDDVVAYYNWYHGDIFGIEIYNKDIATSQATFFDMLWKQAAPTNPTA